MAQAKTLTKEELTRVLDYIRTRRFAPRNRAMMLLTHLAGLRIGEVACLRWSDYVRLPDNITVPVFARENSVRRFCPMHVHASGGPYPW